MDAEGRLYWHCKCGEDVYSTEETCPKCGYTEKDVWRDLFEEKNFVDTNELVAHLRKNHERLQREKP